MNTNIEELMNTNYEGFLKLVEFGIIDKKMAFDAVIESNNAYYIYRFAKNINNVNVEKLCDAICQTGGALWIYRFAKDVIDADIKKLEDAMIQTKNAKYIYYYTCLKGSNKERLCDAICQTGNAKYIYIFARDIEGANIEKLQAAIIETGNEEWIKKYAIEIKGANLEKENNSLRKTQEIKENLMFLLEQQNYIAVLNNREKYEQLFTDESDKIRIRKK